MTISATRRFINIIGEARLSHGALQSERPREPVAEPHHVGKEAFIMATLFPTEICWCPYLPGSRQRVAYQSGAAIECADLQDVVERCRR